MLFLNNLLTIGTIPMVSATVSLRRLRLTGPPSFPIFRYACLHSSVIMPSKYKAFQAWTHPFGSTYPPYRGPPAEHPQARSCLPATLVVSALTKLHAQGSSFVLDQCVLTADSPLSIAYLISPRKLNTLYRIGMRTPSRARLWPVPTYS